VISWVIMRPVNVKITVGRLSGVEKSRKDVREKDMAAGTKL
jgi:hypothetical protein